MPHGLSIPSNAILPIALLLTVPACGSGSIGPGVDGVSPGQSSTGAGRVPGDGSAGVGGSLGDGGAGVGGAVSDVGAGVGGAPPGSGGAGGSSSGGGVVGPPQPAVPTELTPGFINVFWDLPFNATGYDDVTFDIRPAVSGPDDGSLQYFAFGGWQFTQGPPGDGFYGGLQTKIGNQTPTSGHRGVIFSAWGVVTAIPFGEASVDIDLVNCDGGTGAVCAQLSLAYDWGNDTTYRMHYWLAGAAPGSPGNQLLRASVINLTTNQESILGDIIIPQAWGKLPSNYYSFDETFPGPNGQLCTNYNPSDVQYSNLVAQGGGVAAQSWAQGDPAYVGPCIDLFHYDPLPTGYRMRLGIYAAP